MSSIDPVLISLRLFEPKKSRPVSGAASRILVRYLIRVPEDFAHLVVVATASSCNVRTVQ